MTCICCHCPCPSGHGGVVVSMGACGGLLFASKPQPALDPSSNLGRGLNVLIVVRKPHAEIRTRRGESRPWPYSVISSTRVESSLFILFHSVKITLFISSEFVACDFAYPRSITLLLKRRIQSLLNMTFRTCWHNITLPAFAETVFSS